MITSIKKYTKSILAKILIVIIILPFIFWGMGDVFRTGNQNVLATIDSEKISSQEFINYLNQLNLDQQQRKNLGKTDLFEKILTDYVGKKVIALEIKNLGIKLNDSSLKNIIVNDKTFAKDKKFSRTAYEKFLLSSNISASVFEQNISQQEKKRQLLTFLSEGISLPDFLIERSFHKENQIKNIQFLDLDIFYDNILIKDKEIKEAYKKNKKFFSEDYKKINFIELTPDILTGQKEYNELYFKKIDEIENEILDGSEMNDFVKKFNLNILTTEDINSLKKNKTGQLSSKISDKLFVKVFNNRDLNVPSLDNIDNKYYLSEIASVKKITKTLNDKKIKDSIILQIKIQNIIKNNTEIVKDISEGKFDKNKFIKFASEKKLELKRTTIKGIKDNVNFDKDIVKEMFKIKDGDFGLITTSRLDKNYLIYSEKSSNQAFSNEGENYNKYKAKAKLEVANKIYNTYDKSMNDKYKIQINEKVINRIKNTL